MKPPNFEYFAPRTVAEAVGLLGAPDREVKVIAGGQSLIPLMNFRLARPDALVDVAGIEELSVIEVNERGELSIGAGVSQRRVQQDEAVGRGWPLLPQAIHHVGHPQIRTRGTVVGSMVHADPAAEMPAVAVALDATVHLRNLSSTRSVAAADFFKSAMVSDVRAGELVTHVTFPPQPSGARSAIAEVARRPGDFAVAGAVVVLELRDRVVARAAVVLIGVAGTPTRVREVEDLLTGQTEWPDVREAVRRLVRDAIDPSGDGQASPEYRRDAAAYATVSAIDDAWVVPEP